MKRIALLFVIISSYFQLAQAEQFKKSYFVNTPPGSWAKYEMTDTNGMNITYVYKRLTDSEGRIVFEHTSFVNSGPGEGSKATVLYVLEPGFDFDRNMLSYGKAIQVMIGQNNDGAPNLTEGEIIKIIRESGVDFSNSLRFEKREKVGDYECDHYAYNATSGGPRPMKHTGDIWVNENLPFGIVKQTGLIKNDSKIVSDISLKLLEFGDGAEGIPALLSKIPKGQGISGDEQKESVIKSFTLDEAYKVEKLRLKVEVKEGSGGRRLYLLIRNKSRDPIILTLPEGPTDLEAGSPLNILSIYNDSENSIRLEPGQSAPTIEVGQVGTRGALEGRFELTMYEGQALYTGSIKVGTFKE
jgi:hypothetical protein